MTPFEYMWLRLKRSANGLIAFFARSVSGPGSPQPLWLTTPDYSEGMHRSAQIAHELAEMGRRCGAKKCCVDASRAIGDAILAEADDEHTPVRETVIPRSLLR